MSIRDFIKRFKPARDEQHVTWKIDPNEGVDFILTNRAVSEPESLAIDSPYFGMQLAYLKGLVEQDLAMRNANGFTVPSAVIPELDEQFYTLFELPTPYQGAFQARVEGSTGKASFSMALQLSMPRGDVVSHYSLEGPFLKLAENEYYSLSPAEYKALQAVANHKALPPDKRGEYENNWLIFQLQLAKKAGVNIDLAHFNRLELSSPDSVGLSMEELPSGDLLLTPSFGAGIEPEDIKVRLGQISDSDGHCILRIKDRFVLLDEARLEATQEILTNQRIPKSQVATFLKSPTAYLDAALIDLDTGFSLRVHGAERFVHRYFGDVEKSGINWFTSKGGDIEPFENVVSSIDSVERLSDLEELVANAQTNGAQIVEMDGREFDITNDAPVKQTLEKLRIDVNERVTSQEEWGPSVQNEDMEQPKVEQAVVSVDTNDEEVSFFKASHIDKLDITAQSFDIQNLRRTPFEHQEEGIRWFLAHMDLAQQCKDSSGALLADDMGLGKTYMTLVGIHEWYRRCKQRQLAQKPVLIVASLSLLENWQAEVSETFHKSPFSDIVVLQSGADLKTFKVKGAARETQQTFVEDECIENQEEIRYSLKVGREYGFDRLDMPNRLVLTTYQTLRDYQFSLSRIDWGLVAFDEAQNLKNPNTLASRTAMGLKADFKLLATGTPVENSLKDFWCLMDIAVPGLLGAWQDFRNDYIVPITSATPDEASAVKVEIGRKLRVAVGDYMLRRTKAEKLKGLPVKRLYSGDKRAGADQFVPELAGVMTGRQLSQYDDVIEKVKTCSSDEKQSLILSSLHKLKITSIHHDLEFSGKPPSSTNDLFEQAKKSAKVVALLDVLGEVKKRGEKVLIFATTKSVQAYVCALVTSLFKIPVETINGETKAVATKRDNQTRKAIIDRFQSTAGFGVIVMSPVAAGVGLTVVGANNVIHIERHWNPAKEAQATDRVYRIGQKRDVNVYIPMALHPQIPSFDLQLNSLLTNKVDLSDAVVANSSVEAHDLSECF
ncbi:MAG: helicase SNF2 [Kangiellaceae bacterium]|nr:helicase SNF2 [Kangiellaceae bacterium]|tara:strand:+ start:2476 stop:5490 length:3015 start_codon:yes stop_codon:yes gene_type:complete